jgi:phosphatidate cytidylyltransferase
MQQMKIRVITAGIFVAVMLTGMFGGAYTYLLVFGMINFLCLWEFYDMVLGKDRDKSLLRSLVSISLGLFPFVISALVGLEWIVPDQLLLFKLAIAYILGFYLAFVLELFKTSGNALSYLGFTFLGIIYISSAFSILNTIVFQGGAYQMHIVMGIILLVWTNDAAAYFVGSSMGKNFLFPRISPKKTWEGTIGAAIITLIIAYPVSLVFPQLSLGIWIGVTIVILITGGIGDLVESMIKRSKLVKDSSGLLPGHGGFLDRFDAFIFCVPFVAAFLIFTNSI